MPAAYATRRCCQLRGWPAGSAPNGRAALARKSTGSSFHERISARHMSTSSRRRSRRNAGQESNQKRVQHRVVQKHLARERKRWLQAWGRHARRTPVRVDVALILHQQNPHTTLCPTLLLAHISSYCLRNSTSAQSNTALGIALEILAECTKSQPEVWSTLPVNASAV